MSNPPGINLTEEAKELIINLIKIVTVTKEQKYYLFTQLLELWKLDLATGSTPTNAVVDNMKFIKQRFLILTMNKREMLITYVERFIKDLRIIRIMVRLFRVMH